MEISIQLNKNPDAFRAFEHSCWNALSEGYEKIVGPLTAQSAETTLDAAGVTAGCKVLDVCTGHGVLALAASKRAAKVCAIDFAEAMVAAARRNAPAAECLRSDAQDLPYPDNTFDAVICGYGISHIPEANRALAEMRRVLRPGGRVAISVWERPSPNNGFGLVMGAVKAHGRLDVALPQGPEFFQLGDQESLKAALAQTDFVDVNTTFVPMVLPLDRATGFMDAVLNGTVRARALLLAQDEAVLPTIRTAVAQAVARQFRSEDGFRVPMPAIVGSGRKA
jgi:ubiquinone/menaquinone biosynthesis C-methylase UbiE